MASITIRKLDETVKRRLRRRAADNGHSMEAEARDILRAALVEDQRTGADLLKSIRARFEPLGFVDLPEPPRQNLREPPDFD